MCDTCFAGTDEMGHTTICKLTKLKVTSGRDVGHRRVLADHKKVETDELSMSTMKQRRMSTDGVLI